MTDFPGTPSPTFGWVRGVDVSRFQETRPGAPVDVPALRADGADFLYARATWGAQVDSLFASTITQAVEIGLPAGAYGVVLPRGLSSPEEQARRFVETVEGSGVVLAPVCDLELIGATARSTVEAALVWCRTVEQGLGRRVMVYSYKNFLEGLARAAAHDTAVAEALGELATRPLWLARYTGRIEDWPGAPEPWSEAAVWQESGDCRVSPDCARIPGGRVEVDVDYARSLDELLAL